MALMALAGSPFTHTRLQGASTQRRHRAASSLGCNLKFFIFQLIKRVVLKGFKDLTAIIKREIPDSP
jgi:hypothetical protein